MEEKSNYDGESRVLHVFSSHDSARNSAVCKQQNIVRDWSLIDHVKTDVEYKLSSISNYQYNALIAQYAVAL